MNNKGLTDRAQKASLYGWFGGSLSTIVLELYELAGALFVHWDLHGMAASCWAGAVCSRAIMPCTPA